MYKIQYAGFDTGLAKHIDSIGFIGTKEWCWQSMQDVEKAMRAYMKTNKVTVDKKDIDAVLLETLEDGPIEREMNNIQLVPLNFEPHA